MDQMGFDGGPSILAKFIIILLAFGLNCLERIKNKIFVTNRSNEDFKEQFPYAIQRICVPVHNWVDEYTEDCPFMHH